MDKFTQDEIRCPQCLKIEGLYKMFDNEGKHIVCCFLCNWHDEAKPYHEDLPDIHTLEKDQK